jgi:hypothetical protein
MTMKNWTCKLPKKTENWTCKLPNIIQTSTKGLNNHEKVEWIYNWTIISGITVIRKKNHSRYYIITQDTRFGKDFCFLHKNMRKIQHNRGEDYIKLKQKINYNQTVLNLNHSIHAATRILRAISIERRLRRLTHPAYLQLEFISLYTFWDQFYLIQHCKLNRFLNWEVNQRG